MPLPPLPSRDRDTWHFQHKGFGTSSSLWHIASAGGRVVAAGAKFVMLPRGAERFLIRDLPTPNVLFDAMAIEHRAPWRVAFAHRDAVILFWEHKGETRIGRFPCPNDGFSPNQLAWGGVKTPSRLYVRWTDNTLSVIPIDGEETVEFPIERVDALSSDANGIVTLISFQDQPTCYVIEDNVATTNLIWMNESDQARLPDVGSDWDGEDDGEDTFELINAGATMAFSLKDRGTFVSRTKDGGFRWCEALATARPLAFQGASPDAALLGAIVGPGFASVVRVDAEGKAMRIGDVGEAEQTGEPDAFAGIAWDESRRTLWGVAPDTGVIAMTAPDAKKEIARGKN